MGWRERKQAAGKHPVSLFSLHTARNILLVNYNCCNVRPLIGYSGMKGLGYWLLLLIALLWWGYCVGFIKSVAEAGSTVPCCGSGVGCSKHQMEQHALFLISSFIFYFFNCVAQN